MKVQIEFDELRSVCIKNYNGQCEFYRKNVHRCDVKLCPLVEEKMLSGTNE